MTVTIEQAREILGEKISESFSDEELHQVIDDLYYLANSIYDDLE
jgi:hypothetical protein